MKKSIITRKININHLFDEEQNHKTEVRSFYYVDVEQNERILKRGRKIQQVPVYHVGSFETKVERDEYVERMNEYLGRTKYVTITYKKLFHRRVRRINHAFEGTLTPTIEINVVNQGV